MSASLGWHRWTPWFAGGLAVVVVVEGLVATRIGYAAFQFQASALVLASGWITASVGLTTWYRAPGSRIGPLLVAAAAAAFVPALLRFAGAPDGPLRFTWLAVAIVVHTILTAPSGRASSRIQVGLVTGVYLVALALPANGDGWIAVLIATALGLRWLALGPDPRRDPADLAGLVLAAGIGAGSVHDLIAPDLPANPWALGAAALATSALLVATAAIRAGAIPARVTDLVLRLDPAAATSITDELRRLSGDMHLDVAYPVPAGGHVDAMGRPLTLPDSNDVRTVTELGDGSGILLVHDRAHSPDPALRAAVGRAAELAGANARLLGELRAQAAEVRASRLRLLDAEAAERSSVGDRLRARLGPTLDALALDFDGEPDAGLRQTLSDVREELVELAEGLHPRALASGGLANALALLASRSPVNVLLSIDPLPPLRPAVEAAGWFVCNEALSNVAKHAAGSAARVSALSVDGRLLLTVADDGEGGADPDGGTGIHGMRDRVEAVGGRLEIDSAPGLGTVLRALLPLELA